MPYVNQPGRALDEGGKLQARQGRLAGSFLACVPFWAASLAPKRREVTAIQVRLDLVRGHKTKVESSRF